jgi:hypothetical protein
MSANANSSKAYYTVRQIANALHISQQHVNTRTRQAKIAPLRACKAPNSKKLLSVDQIVHVFGDANPEAVRRLFEGQ